MEALPTDWLALAALVFLLGLKHGMDPDHLVTIDGMARFNAVRRPRLSRCSGLLFSLGHGAVATLVAVFRAAPGEVIRAVGLKGRLLGSIVETSHPVVIASVGAAFALSFDTISQAMLFSIAGSSVAGWTFAVLLGLVFTAGMATTDWVNGYTMGRLIARADRRAAAASRVMSLAVALLCFTVAGIALARMHNPVFDSSLEGLGLALGAAVVISMVIAFVVAMRAARSPANVA